MTRSVIDISDELIIDSFAGGGGASTGIEWALGRSPDVAINHNAAAIEMHAANHPGTRHYTEDVFRVAPRKATGGKPVGLLWASPDCRHFSRAKGSQPVKKSVRGLAWVVVKWAVEVRPRVIVLENVREFEEWGPVVPRWECRACDWKGTEGQAVLVRKRPACPRCESRRINPTEQLVPCPKRKGLTFKKFVGRLRNLGYRIEHRVLNAADYGTPTHRRRLFLIARCDGQPIEWPAPTHADPKKCSEGNLFDGPLQPWRTAAECIDFSIPCRSIFDRKKPLAEKTLRRIALGIKRYVLENPKPFLVCCNHSGDRFRGQSVDQPLATVTGIKSHALVMPVLSPQYGRSNGSAANRPCPTITAGGSGKQALVTAFLAKYFGGVVGHEVDRPIGTVTAVDHHSLVTANLIHMNHGAKTWNAVDEPIRTITSVNHAALVYAFLIRYFGTSVGQTVSQPLHTTTTKDRTAIITVSINGAPYAITDIGMRMLTPRELATAQGFPKDFVLTGSATQQVGRIGNSVCPQVAAAIVKANFNN